MNFEIDFNNPAQMDLHMHTTFSDGVNSPAEMVVQAAVMGIRDIGISDHSYTFFDESYCIPLDKIQDYKASLLNIKEKFGNTANTRFQKMLGGNSISFHIGIEQDYYSNETTDFYDYVIGSVHYVRLELARFTGTEIPEGCPVYGRYVYLPVDESKEILLSACQAFYNGDIYAFAEDYYKVVSDVVNRTNCDIIGHFDLFSKFNEDGSVFDPENSRYRKAWKMAVDSLVKTNAVFEINTGAMSKGYRTEPYPSAEIVKYIKQCGGRLIYSSDAHRTETIAFDFKEL